MLLRRLFTPLAAALLIAASWQQRATAGRAQSPYLVVIVMDGFRPDYMTLAPMRHLHELMVRGSTYDTAWVGQMETETPTGHATIATGVYPRKHGVVGFGWRNTATGSFTFMPTDLRQIRAGALWRQIESGGVPTLSDLIHTRNRHDLAISLSGEKYYASATMGTGADYILYGKDTGNAFRPMVLSPNVPPASSHYLSVKGDASIGLQDQFASTLAVQLVRTMRPRALFLNLPGTDIAGHYYGGMSNPPGMTGVIRGADWAIGRVMDEYKRLGIYDKTLFVVTADHGMAANRHIVPIHPMYKAVADTKIPSLDEEFRITVGSIWLRDSRQASTVASAVAAKHFLGIDGALYKDQSNHFVPEASTATHLSNQLVRAYTNLADTENGPTGPDVILPYGEDTMGLTVKRSKRWGSHGGFSWGVQHIPLILAGPGVHHVVSHFPAKLVDIAPTIERLLGLPIPPGVDGVVLDDTLRGHASASLQAVAKPRLQDVQVLRAHSVQQSRQR